MSLQTALSIVIAGFITREAPTVMNDPVKHDKYVSDITTLVGLHNEVSNGRLINHDMDVLLLSAVNYRESRLKNPTVDGDCHFEHPLQNVPSGQWPKDYKPVYKQVCHAVGPMQLSRGNVGNLTNWEEVVEEFSGDRGWLPSSPATFKQNRFKVEDLRDPKTNIRIAYAELAHWKYECRGPTTDAAPAGEEAPVGVWFTAYRYGHCPVRNRAGHFYIDEEAKERCKLVQRMVEGLTDDAAGLAPLHCTY